MPHLPTVGRVQDRSRPVFPSVVKDTSDNTDDDRFDPPDCRSPVQSYLVTNLRCGVTSKPEDRPAEAERSVRYRKQDTTPTYELTFLVASGPSRREGEHRKP